MSHTVYIALGSNIGNRAGHLHDSLDALGSYMDVEETSHLYETLPMLVTDQPLFLNAVCKGSTTLRPLELLRACKQIEDALGRMKTIRYGPRNIDLDILFYDDATINTADLTVPHIRIPERDFVLAPLVDLAPDLRHPRLGLTVQELWQQLNKPTPPRVMPIGERLWHWGQRTYVMGILHLTPDSGDGLANAPDPVALSLARAQQFGADGADVLEVGGCSTRPGHVDVPLEEEMRRVVPLVEALHAHVDLPLSVDTFRAQVAEAALDAGASWLNDVSGLRFLGVLAARRRVPLVLMHNRTMVREHPTPQATAVTGQRSVASGQCNQDMPAAVCQGLAESLERARRAGVPRWHRIIDPGIGFGKTFSQHAMLIARLPELQRLGYPLLFGSARKGFLGNMAGDVPIEERLAGTIATNVLAVERGAQIVRVHDVWQNVQALRLVDAIVRYGTLHDGD